MPMIRRFVLVALALAALASPALAAWPNDPFTGGVPVCNATSIQGASVSCSDGAGGAFIAWQDNRVGSLDVYVQRINAAGVAQWTSNGVAVCTATSTQSAIQVAPDGSGGVAVVWQDVRSGSYDIYAQRLNGSGVVQWTANGVAVCTASQDQTSPVLAVDTGGEITIAWSDFRGGANYDVYAQRLSSTGVAQWTANGVALCTAAGQQLSPRIVQAAASSMIVVWEDSRTGTTDVYGQRISGPGSLQWALDGVGICVETGSQSGISAMPDGTGGAFLCWGDVRSGNFDVYCQRINNSGTPLWTPTGTPVCVATGTQALPVLASDGSGGIILAWSDSRLTSAQVYAQRISASGVALWATDGIAVRNISTSQVSGIRIVADGARGAIVAWDDFRPFSNTDIYAQRLSSQGTALWPTNGTAVTAAFNSQFSLTMVSNGDAGALLAWTDERVGGAADDIYCQRIERYGQIGEPQAVITGVRDVANDQGGQVRVSWTASYLDVEPEFGIYDYRLWRQVPVSLAAQRALRQGMSEDPDQAAARRQLWFGAQAYAWELVTSQPANALSDYSLTTATTSDSIGGSNPRTVFMVEARTGDWVGADRWYSAPDSGYSVDDLAPAAPAPFTGHFDGSGTRMAWNPNTEADLQGYRLYRGSSVAFVPGPANLVSAQPDTGYIDAAGAPYIYKLTAVDIHGNESPVATLIPTGTLGMGGDAPARLALSGMHPNPLRDRGEVRFTLSRGGEATLRLIDVSGREVAVLARGPHRAGTHAVSWHAGDRSLAAGVYFLQLAAEGSVLTRRVVLGR